MQHYLQRGKTRGHNYSLRYLTSINCCNDIAVTSLVNARASYTYLVVLVFPFHFFYKRKEEKGI